MAKKQRRPEHKPKQPRHKRPGRDRKAPKKRPGQPDVTELKESGRFPKAMPAAQQAGLNPQDYPNDAATYSTGPAEAPQYHYSRQDLYAEQYAQEQVAAEQQASTAGAGLAPGGVPGPGQAGVSYA